MRANHFRTTVVAGFALLGLAAGAAAQERQNLLTSIEVKRLVSSAELTDHTRLRDHFAALSDQYTTAARRDKNLARAPWGNPNRRSGATVGSKYTRLAEQATASAAIARELAAHHERLAAGLPSTPPKDSAGFEAGAGAPAPSVAQLRELAAGARTPADHRSLEEYFTTLAETQAKVEGRHRNMAAMYRGSGNRRTLGGDPAIHCDRQVKQAREAAAEARATAAEHRQLVQVG
ncbi:MAG TPA: hypothetical protein VI485_12580 [Vicinamibacterales bacterium]|nr:hypothetical protein [Vicinamibacterales bacterium]